MDMYIDIIIAAAAAALITAIATWLIVRVHYRGRMKALQEVHEKRLEDMESFRSRPRKTTTRPVLR
jgi:ABC-type nickel/cobalt efflux system permease component RcnA